MREDSNLEMPRRFPMDVMIWSLVRVSYAKHPLKNPESQRFARACYTFSRNLNKTIFNKNYPANPRPFGERLRKARMDAGLQIRDSRRR
jgi:hypothetical protein